MSVDCPILTDHAAKPLGAGLVFLDLTLPTLAENLALDEALLLQAEADGPEVLRLWQYPSTAVVLGAGGKIADDVDIAACRRDRVPVCRRSSGGGTVLLGPGCLLYALVLDFQRRPALQEIRPSYCFILGKLAQALSTPEAPVKAEGTSDLAIHERKVSGNSQQRKRRHVLHHGTLLYDFAIADMGRYLLPPPRQPEYRQQRTHVDFMANLARPAPDLKKLLQTTWQATEVLPSWPKEMVAQLVEEKYSRHDWVERR